jgi:hypothetical protein
MSAPSRRYRLRLATALPARFSSWFPNLTSRTNDDNTTTVEGPVADSCQLAGIISAICHRNGEILSVEQMDSNPDQQD